MKYFFFSRTVRHMRSFILLLYRLVLKSGLCSLRTQRFPGKYAAGIRKSACYYLSHSGAIIHHCREQFFVAQRPKVISWVWHTCCLFLDNVKPYRCYYLTKGLAKLFNTKVCIIMIHILDYRSLHVLFYVINIILYISCSSLESPYSFKNSHNSSEKYN